MRHYKKEAAMMRMMIFALAWATATMGSTLAASNTGVTLSPDKRIVYSPPAGRATSPYRARRADQVVIFDNFATLDPKGVYMDGTGFAFGGPNSAIGFAALAAAFVPTQAATVTEVEVAAGYIEGAKHDVLVTIYADDSGKPGSKLWQGESKMPIDGTCCKTVALEVTAGPQLAPGEQYWIGLRALPKGSDTFAAWLFNVADQVDAAPSAVDIGSGWMINQALPNVAFAIYGN
jgi:hypothetical protein